MTLITVNFDNTKLTLSLDEGRESPTNNWFEVWSNIVEFSKMANAPHFMDNVLSQFLTIEGVNPLRVSQLPDLKAPIIETSDVKDEFIELAKRAYEHYMNRYRSFFDPNVKLWMQLKIIRKKRADEATAEYEAKKARNTAAEASLATYTERLHVAQMWFKLKNTELDDTKKTVKRKEWELEDILDENLLQETHTPQVATQTTDTETIYDELKRLYPVLDELENEVQKAENAVDTHQADMQAVQHAVNVTRKKMQTASAAMEKAIQLYQVVETADSLSPQKTSYLQNSTVKKHEEEVYQGVVSKRSAKKRSKRSKQRKRSRKR